MAVHIGTEGTVKVGTAGSDTAIAEIKSFSIEETTDTVETTSMGSTARTYSATLKSFTGTVDVQWDETDTTGQGALQAASEVTINFYPEGSDTGDTYYTGTAIVTGRTINVSFDDVTTMSLSLQGDGALTETIV